MIGKAAAGTYKKMRADDLKALLATNTLKGGDLIRAQKNYIQKTTKGTGVTTGNTEATADKLTDEAGTTQ